MAFKKKLGILEWYFNKHFPLRIEIIETKCEFIIIKMLCQVFFMLTGLDV